MYPSTFMTGFGLKRSQVSHFEPTASSAHVSRKPRAMNDPWAELVFGDYLPWRELLSLVRFIFRYWFGKKLMDRQAIERVFERVKQRYKVNITLKREQLDILHSILNNEDCMGILGTGFGKSMCYVIPPLILDELNPQQRHMSLVISPLRSLMQDQVTQLEEYGVKAAAVLQESEMPAQLIEDIKTGQFSVVYISPEAANGEMWSTILREPIFRKMVSVVAIDEAHCVIQWGKSFREDFMRISWLRPVMKAAVFLFLTATCTADMKDEILRVFAVQSVNVIAAVPNRPNIHLSYKSYPAMKLSEELKFYIEELRTNGRLARKCIIYTNVNPAGEIYEEIMNRLRDRAFTDGKRMIDIFVASTSEDAKNDILDVFPSTASHIRCLIASSAFGMGVNIPDVELVIHWGASSTVLSYWQEVGRCGRDGRPAHALLLATAKTLSDKRKTEDCMRRLHREIMTDKSCIRLAVLKCLYLECMGEEELNKVSRKDTCSNHCERGKCVCAFCSCCSICESTCPCSSSEQCLHS